MLQISFPEEGYADLHALAVSSASCWRRSPIVMGPYVQVDARPFRASIGFPNAYPTRLMPTVRVAVIGVVIVFLVVRLYSLPHPG